MDVMDPAELARQYLLFFVLPLWLAAGLADYILHRRTRIEDTSGTTESVLHVLQLAEMGVPVLLGLLVEINALVFLVMLVALALHEATALYDLRYTFSRRAITPLEQHVHSFLEVLPVMGVSLLSLLYWDQFLSLFGLGSAAPRWTLEGKATPLSHSYLIALFAAVTVFVVVPFGEELWRCVRTAHARRLGTRPRIGRAA